MKEELQGKLVEILTQIQSTVGQAKDFTLQQLPDIAQSYIYYGVVSSVVWFWISSLGTSQERCTMAGEQSAQGSQRGDRRSRTRSTELTCF
jgi:hypothetical protein